MEIQPHIAVVHGNGSIAVQRRVCGLNVSEIHVETAVPEGAGLAPHITVGKGECTGLGLVGFGEFFQFQIAIFQFHFAAAAGKIGQIDVPGIVFHLAQILHLGVFGCEIAVVQHQGCRAADAAVRDRQFSGFIDGSQTRRRHILYPAVAVIQIQGQGADADAGNGAVSGTVCHSHCLVFRIRQGHCDLRPWSGKRVESETGKAVPRLVVGTQLDVQGVVFYSDAVAVLRDILCGDGKRTAVLHGHIGAFNIHQHGGKSTVRGVGIVGEIQHFHVAFLIQCAGMDGCAAADRSGTEQADTGDDPRFHFHFWSLLLVVLTACSSCANCAAGRVMVISFSLWR